MQNNQQEKFSQPKYKLWICASERKTHVKPGKEGECVWVVFKLNCAHAKFKRSRAIRSFACTLWFKSFDCVRSCVIEFASNNNNIINFFIFNFTVINLFTWICNNKKKKTFKKLSLNRNLQTKKSKKIKRGVKWNGDWYEDRSNENTIECVNTNWSNRGKISGKRACAHFNRIRIRISVGFLKEHRYCVGVDSSIDSINPYSTRKK